VMRFLYAKRGYDQAQKWQLAGVCSIIPNVRASHH